MAQYHVKRPIQVDGKRFGADRTVDLDPERAGPLEAIGAVVRIEPAPEPRPEEPAPKRGGKRG